MSAAPRAFEISTPIAIRTYDIDFAGIVSNIVYLRWLEDMRLLWLETVSYTHLTLPTTPYV